MERGIAIAEGCVSFPSEALRGQHPFCDARASRPHLTSSARSASIAGPALTSIGTMNRGSSSSAADARKEGAGRASPECSITARYGCVSGRPARTVDLFSSRCPPMERVRLLKAACSLKTRSRQNVGAVDGFEVIERALGVDGVVEHDRV